MVRESTKLRVQWAFVYFTGLYNRDYGNCRLFPPPASGPRPWDPPSTFCLWVCLLHTPHPSGVL